MRYKMQLLFQVLFNYYSPSKILTTLEWLHELNFSTSFWSITILFFLLFNIYFDKWKKTDTIVRKIDFHTQSKTRARADLSFFPPNTALITCTDLLDSMARSRGYRESCPFFENQDDFNLKASFSGVHRRYLYQCDADQPFYTQTEDHWTNFCSILDTEYMFYNNYCLIQYVSMKQNKSTKLIKKHWLLNQGR